MGRVHKDYKGIKTIYMFFCYKNYKAYNFTKKRVFAVDNLNKFRN